MSLLDSQRLKRGMKGKAIPGALQQLLAYRESSTKSTAAPLTEACRAGDFRSFSHKCASSNLDARAFTRGVTLDPIACG